MSVCQLVHIDLRNSFEKDLLYKDFFVQMSNFKSTVNKVKINKINNKSLFLQDSRLAVLGCVPAASISSLSYVDLQWLCSCDLVQFIVGYFMWPLDSSHLFQLCSMKTV